MSGAEVIGLISGIITLIEASRAVYNAASDSKGLPRSFRDVAARLPAVQDTLETAQKGLLDADFSPASPSATSGDSLAKVLASCLDKAASLKKIFEAVIPSANASRAERYRKALLTIPNGGKVEELMVGVMRDLEVLAGNHAVKAATREQVDRLAAAVRQKGEKAGGGGGRSGPASGGGARSAGTVVLRNFGCGSQYIKSGPGDQNIATGGIQINGQSTGPFYFSRAGQQRQGGGW
ncbi:hypothetical protein MAPG_00083 [Magnaporthiopsis poae ATCC 64411]|uniref:NACHT-NTPase and P-loop NTPases N-terminal domain-containing protein n=1 Tax=Magnaporthiopsis poae (strain ATCC 64411 / 73-15) TaxID=644358 RepID=A0A0C4DK20_MAGP6|nr:hypothetical protein MAPG_00083 [Magnaporthiopsis poae ATCC 64411]